MHSIEAENELSSTKRSCARCANRAQLGFEFSYAFQPIVDTDARTVFAHEALVRGSAGESADSILSRVNDDNRYAFDQSCRVKAITSAASLGIAGLLSINFLPNAIYRPELCIRTTLDAAHKSNLPLNRIMFEAVEGERLADTRWFGEVFREYKKIGFLTAIDDFGAGYAGLNLLADFQPDIVKLDMGLIRNIDSRRSAQAIVRGVTEICRELDITVISEGVETFDEYVCLRSMGLTLMQGYLFARPLFESCATVADIKWPIDDRAMGHTESSPGSAVDIFPKGKTSHLFRQ